MVSLLRHLAERGQRQWIIPLAAFALMGTPSFSQAQDNPTQNKVSQFVEEILESEVELKVGLRRSKIIRMKQDVFRVAMADPEVVEVVAFGSREIEVIGKQTGSTTVTLWLGNVQQSTTLSLLVSVSKDDAVDDRRRMEYGELQTMINELFPNSKIQLFPVADKLIVRGQARDEQEAVQIMAVLRKNAAAVLGGATQLVQNGQASDPFPDASTLPQANIVNMMTVPGEKQVMLKVRIAELKRSAVRNLGVNLDVAFKEFFVRSALTSGTNLAVSGLFSEGRFN
ncbi:MAG: type and secretion system protein, partial [Planctomycetaceae bacterium]|nr:type and secretion system protein [Planctomycetaceae bacterium]